MFLKYPTNKDMQEWRRRIYPIIYADPLYYSAYRLIAIAQQGTDIYVCFTNQEEDNVWIEKTSTLLGEQGMYLKSFQKIEDDEEFNFAFNFFVEKGILDG